MKQTKLLVLSLLISQCVMSQIYEVGMYFGGSNFIGDVGSTSYIAPKEIVWEAYLNGIEVQDTLTGYPS